MRSAPGTKKTPRVGFVLRRLFGAPSPWNEKDGPRLFRSPIPTRGKRRPQEEAQAGLRPAQPGPARPAQPSRPARPAPSSATRWWCCKGGAPAATCRAPPTPRPRPHTHAKRRVPLGEGVCVFFSRGPLLHHLFSLIRPYTRNFRNSRVETSAFAVSDLCQNPLPPIRILLEKNRGFRNRVPAVSIGKSGTRPQDSAGGRGFWQRSDTARGPRQLRPPNIVQVLARETKE